MDDREYLCKTIREMTPAAFGAFADFLRQRGFITKDPAPVEPPKPKEKEMFGKGKTQMSASNKFVMDMGRKVGNLRAPMKKSDPSTATTAAKASSKAGTAGRTHLGAIGKAKLTPAAKSKR